MTVKKMKTHHLQRLAKTKLSSTFVAMAALLPIISFAAIPENTPEPATELSTKHKTVLPTEINWQLSLADIKQQQTLTLTDEQATRLTYDKPLFGQAFHQEYLFTPEGSLKNILFYHSVAADGIACTDDYKQIKQQVVQQLGVTKLSELSNKPVDSLDKSSLCQLTASGEYKLYSEWLKPNTKITLVLDTWKGQPYIGLSYTRSPSKSVFQSELNESDSKRTVEEMVTPF